MRRPGTFTAVALIAGLLLLRAEAWGSTWQTYLFKPLTTAAILGVALTSGRPGRYRTAIAFGLLFGLAGDVFLMLPQDLFVAGLAAFLVGHLAYLRAFTTEVGWGLSVRTAWPFLLLAGAVYLYLAPHLGPLRGPVILYMLVISAMAWQALERHRRIGAGRAAAGAALFLVSDTALAIERFAGPYPGDALLILTTYFLAQWLIARSTESAGTTT